MSEPSTSAVAIKSMSDQAKASYERCCEKPDFIPSFYQTFFATCPEAKPLFADTNFRRQHNLLRHALSLLLIFPTKPPAEGRSLLRRVAERHSRADLDVDPAMYGPFVDSLLGTVERYDPEFSPEIEAAWRATVAKGVEYMVSKY